MDSGHHRLSREKRTVEAMVSMYCRDHHGKSPALCPDCGDLARYAGERLDACPFGEGKPTCAKCPIHCYTPDMRHRIREVMRYAGPRMTYRHLILALHHLRDGRRRVPHKSSVAKDQT